MSKSSPKPIDGQVRDHRQNSFPVAWRDWADDGETKRIINGLVEEVGISVRLTGRYASSPGPSPVSHHSDGESIGRRRGRPPDPKPYADVTFRLLLNLFRVSNTDPSAWIGYSRTRADYSDRVVYPKSVTYHRVVKVVSWLRELGWVCCEPGYFNWQEKYGWQSLIRASPTLANRLSGFAPVVVQAPFTDRELIRLKDSEKNLILDYADSPQLAAWRRELRRINQQIAGSTLGFGLDIEHRRAMLADLRSRKAVPDFSRIQLYRSFNEGSWEHGGRFYGGWWINLPREYRPHITINGEPTRELDYSAFHISMIYGLEGQPMPSGDLYDIGWDIQYRPMIKKFVNALLYADDEDAAIRAMLDFREDDVRSLWAPFEDLPPAVAHGRENGVLRPMLADIKQLHEAVAHRFGNGDSTRLQSMDAKMAEQVLMMSVWLNETVLPIHDSFIVPVRQAGYFETHMQQTFEAFFAQRIEVKGK